MLKRVLDILASTPEKLRREIEAMSPREMKAAPAPGKWSVQVVLAHLEDMEMFAMRGRVEAMVTKDHPFLNSFDQVERAAELHYDRKDPWKSLASFTRKRKRNLRWLRAFRPSDLKRTGLHQRVGEINVSDFVNEWAFHDLGHLKQILEIKRSALFPLMGNMRKFYTSS